MKDLLRTEDLSRQDVELLLNSAKEFAENPLKAASQLANKTVAIYMTKPSTRTRLASESAVAHLGGHPIFLRGEDLQLGRGETIADTARIISGFSPNSFADFRRSSTSWRERSSVRNRSFITSVYRLRT